MPIYPWIRTEVAGKGLYQFHCECSAGSNLVPPVYPTIKVSRRVIEKENLANSTIFVGDIQYVIQFTGKENFYYTLLYFFVAVSCFFLNKCL